MPSVPLPLTTSLVFTGSVVLLAYRSKKERYGNDLDFGTFRELWALRLGDASLMRVSGRGGLDDNGWADVKAGMLALLDPDKASVRLADGSLLERDDSEGM